MRLFEFAPLVDVVALVYGRDAMGRGVICKIQRALVNGQDVGGELTNFQ
jgi:hypothetical protein